MLYGEEEAIRNIMLKNSLIEKFKSIKTSAVRKHDKKKKQDKPVIDAFQAAIYDLGKQLGDRSAIATIKPPQKVTKKGSLKGTLKSHNPLVTRNRSEVLEGIAKDTPLRNPLGASPLGHVSDTREHIRHSPQSLKLVRYLGSNVVYNKNRIQNYDENIFGQLCIKFLKLLSD